MRIAYLGWGSLIWNSQGLRIVGDWQNDGPLLPVEFARISKNKTLTLVLYHDASEVRTLWTRTTLADLELAVQKLARRERTTNDNVGFVCVQDNRFRCNVVANVLHRIRTWASQKKLDAVVWTDLSSNFKEVTNLDLNEDNVIDYIMSLSEEDLKNAETYVRKAPMQVDTRIRRKLKVEFGWRCLEEYQNGFWLNENTFVKADKAQIELVDRRDLGNPYGTTQKMPMLILTNAIEMIVGKNGKILGLEKHTKFGLWLDAVNKILRDQDIAGLTRGE